jgi:hypothetical protein
MDLSVDTVKEGFVEDLFLSFTIPSISDGSFLNFDSLLAISNRFS